MTSTNSTQTKTVDVDMKMQSIDVSAWFGTKQALKNINIGIKTNAVTAIIGPSGCGKSTFIRCLNRMHELTPNAKMTGQILLMEKTSTTNKWIPCRFAEESAWFSRSQTLSQRCPSTIMLLLVYV